MSSKLRQFLSDWKPKKIAHCSQDFTKTLFSVHTKHTWKKKKKGEQAHTRYTCTSCHQKYSSSSPRSHPPHTTHTCTYTIHILAHTHTCTYTIHILAHTHTCTSDHQKYSTSSPRCTSPSLPAASHEEENGDSENKSKTKTTSKIIGFLIAIHCAQCFLCSKNQIFKEWIFGF